MNSFLFKIYKKFSEKDGSKPMKNYPDFKPAFLFANKIIAIALALTLACPYQITFVPPVRPAAVEKNKLDAPPSAVEKSKPEPVSQKISESLPKIKAEIPSAYAAPGGIVKNYNSGESCSDTQPICDFGLDGMEIETDGAGNAINHSGETRDPKPELTFDVYEQNKEPGWKVPPDEDQGTPSDDGNGGYIWDFWTEFAPIELRTKSTTTEADCIPGHKPVPLGYPSQFHCECKDALPIEDPITHKITDISCINITPRDSGQFEYIPLKQNTPYTIVIKATNADKADIIDLVNNVEDPLATIYEQLPLTYIIIKNIELLPTETGCDTWVRPPSGPGEIIRLGDLSCPNDSSKKIYNNLQYAFDHTEANKKICIVRGEYKPKQFDTDPYYPSDYYSAYGNPPTINVLDTNTLPPQVRNDTVPNYFTWTNKNVYIQGGFPATCVNTSPDPENNETIIKGSRRNGELCKTYQPSDPEYTTSHCDETGRAIVMHGLSSSSKLNGITIQDSYAPNGYGGGILSFRGPSTTDLLGRARIENVRFKDNYADLGGGAIANFYSRNTIAKSTFENNGTTASGSNELGIGGAIYNFKSAPLINACKFTGNSAFDGGAIANEGCYNDQLDAGNYEDNATAQNLWEGIENENPGYFDNCEKCLGNPNTPDPNDPTKLLCSKIKIWTCLRRMSSMPGACSHDYRTAFNVINSVFTKNKALNKGGAIYNFKEADAKIFLSTLYENNARIGNALLNENIPLTLEATNQFIFPPVIIFDSILWGNGGPGNTPAAECDPLPAIQCVNTPSCLTNKNTEGSTGDEICNINAGSFVRGSDIEGKYPSWPPEPGASGYDPKYGQRDDVPRQFIPEYPFLNNLSINPWIVYEKYSEAYLKHVMPSFGRWAQRTGYLGQPITEDFTVFYDDLGTDNNSGHIKYLMDCVSPLTGECELMDLNGSGDVTDNYSLEFSKPELPFGSLVIDFGAQRNWLHYLREYDFKSYDPENPFPSDYDIKGTPRPTDGNREPPWFRPENDFGAYEFDPYSYYGLTVKAVLEPGGGPLLTKALCDNYSTENPTIPSGGNGCVQVRGSSPVGIPHESDGLLEYIKKPPFERIRLTAIPNTNYYFAGWSGDLQGIDADTGNIETEKLALTGDKTVTAHFIYGAPGNVTLTVNNTNATGIVKKDNVEIPRPFPKMYTIARGTTVNLEAIAGDDPFVNWTGTDLYTFEDFVTAENPTSLFMNHDKEITANFMDGTGNISIIHAIVDKAFNHGTIVAGNNITKTFDCDYEGDPDYKEICFAFVYDAANPPSIYFAPETQGALVSAQKKTFTGLPPPPLSDGGFDDITNSLTGTTRRAYEFPLSDPAPNPVENFQIVASFTADDAPPITRLKCDPECYPSNADNPKYLQIGSATKIKLSATDKAILLDMDGDGDVDVDGTDADGSGNDFDYYNECKADPTWHDNCYKTALIPNLTGINDFTRCRGGLRWETKNLPDGLTYKLAADFISQPYRYDNIYDVDSKPALSRRGYTFGAILSWDSDGEVDPSKWGDIYFHNSFTHENINITQSPEGEMFQTISDNYIVYTKLQGDAGVYYYNINTPQSTKLLDYSPSMIKLSDDRIIYDAQQNGGIYTCQITKNNEPSGGCYPNHASRILLRNGAGSAGWQHQIYKNKMVWQGHRIATDPTSPVVVLLCDLEKLPAEQLCSDTANRVEITDKGADPSIYDNRIVYLKEDNNVYMYEAGADGIFGNGDDPVERKVTNYSTSNIRSGTLAVSDRYITWADGNYGSLFMCDLRKALNTSGSCYPGAIKIPLMNGVNTPDPDYNQNHGLWNAENGSSFGNKILLDTFYLRLQRDWTIVIKKLFLYQEPDESILQHPYINDSHGQPPEKTCPMLSTLAQTGVEKIRYTIDDPSLTNFLNYDSSEPISLKLQSDGITLRPEGLYTIRAWAIDHINYNKFVYTYDFGIDATAPGVNYASFKNQVKQEGWTPISCPVQPCTPISTVYIPKNEILKLKVVDPELSGTSPAVPGSGPQHLRIKTNLPLSDYEWADWPSDQATWTAAWPTFPSYPHTVTIDYQASDNTQNVSPEYTLTVILTDNTRPIADDAELTFTKNSQDNPINLSELASDAETASLSLDYYITSKPGKGTLREGTTDIIALPYLLTQGTTVKYTPLPNEIASPYTSFTYEAYDGQFSDSGTITINVVENQGVEISGTVFDKGGTERQVNVPVNLSINGSPITTQNTAADGTFNFPVTSIDAGQPVLLYTAGLANYVTMAKDAVSSIENIVMRNNTLTISHETRALGITKTLLKSASAVVPSDLLCYSYNASNTTLTVDYCDLRIQSGKHFIPDSNITFTNQERNLILETDSQLLYPNSTPKYNILVTHSVYLETGSQFLADGINAITVNWNWRSSDPAAFIPGTSTVILTPMTGVHKKQQAIYGSTTFYNLTKTTGGQGNPVTGILYFEAGSTQTIKGLLTLST